MSLLAACLLSPLLHAQPAPVLADPTTGAIFRPSAITGNLVGTTATQTLTNKTFVAPVLGVASATSLAVGATPDSSGALLFSAPSSVTASPWRMVHFVGTFDGQADPTWAFGYNVANVTGRFNASDSAAWYGIEADYYVNFTGRGAGLQHYQEHYLRFTGSGGNTLTGLGLTSDKTNPFAYTIGSIGIAGAGSAFNFNDVTTGSEVSMVSINKTGPTLRVDGYLGINADPSSTYRLLSAASTAGQQNTLRVVHSDGTNNASISRLQLQTTAGGGDAYAHWVIDAATDVEYTLGLDNSDSDAFVLSRGDSLGTRNVFRVTADAADTGSVITFPGTFGIGTAPTDGRKMILGGTWAPTDGSAVGFEIVPAITPAAGNAGIGLYVNPSFTEASSGTHAFVASLYMAAPVVTNAGGSTTEAATLKIGGAPTGQGTTKYALRVDGGVTSSADTTEATTAGAGSVITAGGIYAAKKIVTSSDLEVADTGEGLILKSPDGTRYRITVANGGTLTVTSL